jgi:cytochrome c553
MPKHIVRLVLLLVVFAIVAYSAKQYFTVASYYLYGHYRGASVASIASDKPKYKGTAYCVTCHAVQTAEWSKGVHNSVDQGKVIKCEVCHGPGGSRDVKGPFENVSTGNDHPKNLKMAVPTDTAKLCTLCHEQIAGRPAQQPQIVIAGHAGTLQCTTCHNPHSPKTIAGSVLASALPGDAVAGKAAAARCDGCHAAPAAASPAAKTDDVASNTADADDFSGAAPAGGQAASSLSLAGQRPAYLVEAMRAYKTGQRDDPRMLRMVQNLSDADMQNIAAYYAGLSCGGGAAQDNAEAAAGRALANNDNCLICHGASGVSRQPLWPNLAGLSKDYGVTALKAYRNGDRKNAMMSVMAKDLSDTDAAKLVAFFAGTGCK